MSEVVINACYGGFSLSIAAIERYSELKGLAPGTRPNREIPRDDPVLIQVVKELGDKANGPYAILRVEIVEPGTLYRIDEYDGLEGIETRDGIEWRLAT